VCEKCILDWAARKKANSLYGNSGVVNGVVCQPASGEETEVGRRESFLT
jgi:hypothetical protein